MLQQPTTFSEWAVMMLNSWPYLLVGLVILLIVRRVSGNGEYLKSWLTLLPILAAITLCKAIGELEAFILAMSLMFVLLFLPLLRAMNGSQSGATRK